MKRLVYRAFKVKRHFPLVEEGFADAPEWADGSVDEVAPDTVRAKTVRNATSMERLGGTLFRAVGAKVKGESLGIAKGVGRDRGFVLRRR